MTRKPFQKPGKLASGQIPQVPGQPIELDETLASEDVGYSFLLLQHLSKISQLLASAGAPGAPYNLHSATEGMVSLLTPYHDEEFKREVTELDAWEQKWRSEHIIKSPNFMQGFQNQRSEAGFYVLRSRKLLSQIVALMSRKNLLPEGQGSEVIGHG